MSTIQAIKQSIKQSISMSTQLQTVEITMPGSKNIIHSLEEYPVCPVKVPKEGSIWLDTEAGDTYMWDEDGVSILSYDGTHRFFRKKPTLADAVHNECEYTASCFNFLKDGSVEHRLDTRCYWWGPTYSGMPVKGHRPRSYNDEDEGPCCQTRCELCRDDYSDYYSDYDGCDTCQSKNCRGGCSDY